MRTNSPMPEEYHPKPTPETEPVDLDDDDDSIEATMERFKRIYAEQLTVMDQLRELANDKDRVDEFQTLLDDIAYDILKSNPEYATNIQLIHANTLPRETLIEIRNRQQEMSAEVKDAILQESGINTEAAKTDMVVARENIRQIVESQVDTTNCAPSEVLSALGILSKNEKGKEQFTYPRGLFPKSTDAKWDTYLETVREDLANVKRLKHGLIVKADVKEADSVRHAAHNAVTRDLDMLLGLQELPESRWTTRDTRDLLGKMRDTTFPGEESAEVRRTGEAVIAGAIGYEALKKLVKRCDTPDDHSPGTVQA